MPKDHPDIERKSAETNVLEGQPAQKSSLGNEELFRFMVESVKDYAIFSTDTVGRVVSWNTGAEHVFGYTEAEIMGRSAAIIFTPEDIAIGAPEQEMRTAEREGRAEDERWHMRRDGSRFWASGIMTPLRDETGNMRGFVKIARDNTGAGWRRRRCVREKKNSRISLRTRRSVCTGSGRTELSCGSIFITSPSAGAAPGRSLSEHVWQN